MSLRVNDLFSVVSAMGAVNRFSGTKMCHAENVLAHTGMVAIFCMVIGHARGWSSDSVKMRELLTRALVHDMDETVTGDVARPTKYFSDTLRKELKRLEDAAMLTVAHKLDMPEVTTLHMRAKQYDEIGDVVRLADLMAAAHRCYEELAQYGNNNMLNAAEGVMKNLHLYDGQDKTLNMLRNDTETLLGWALKNAHNRTATL